MTEQRYETGAGRPGDDATRELRTVDVVAEQESARSTSGSETAPGSTEPAAGPEEPGAAPPEPAPSRAEQDGEPGSEPADPARERPSETSGGDGRDLTAAASALAGSVRTARRVTRPATSAARTRRARLQVRRVDILSVFLLALLLSLFLAIVIVVAVVALYAVLAAAGVPGTINDLVAEITRASGEAATEPEPLLTARRAVTAAGVVAAVDVVLLTALSTLGALLYNLCASFTGGLTVTLAEPEER